MLMGTGPYLIEAVTVERDGKSRRHELNVILPGVSKDQPYKVTLNRDGTVASVTLSDNQIPELSSCLSRTVQGWKFHPGPAKNYGFTLVPPR